MPVLTVFLNRCRERGPKRAHPSPLALAIRFFIASPIAFGRSPLATALSIAASAAALAAGTSAALSTPSCLANSSRKVWQYAPGWLSTARLPSEPVAAGVPGFAKTVLISVPPTIADATRAPATSRAYRRFIDLCVPRMMEVGRLEALRQHGAVPILVTSAKRTDAERIAGLRMGADDYLAKPFNPHELTARVAAILRRAQPNSQATEWIISLDGGRLVLDPVSRRYTLVGDGVHPEGSGRLTPGEARLIAALARNPGVVLSRERLLEAVARRPDEVYDRVVDVHVANLRRKLGDD